MTSSSTSHLEHSSLLEWFKMSIEKNTEEGIEMEGKESAPSNGFKHEIDADEALKAIRGDEYDDVELDEATNKRVLRKIDRNLMPVS